MKDLKNPHNYLNRWPNKPQRCDTFQYSFMRNDFSKGRTVSMQRQEWIEQASFLPGKHSQHSL